MQTTTVPIHERFKALGDQTRFSLMQLLIEKQGICVSELADEVDVSVAGVSQQLKILEQSGLVSRVRSGQKICYQPALSDPSVKQILKLIDIS